ncbi:hypothetical protein [Pedobacter faecalis]|uniref:hypothetical protein n=1 Tax=Pedobacter faecalis TaxID=3041495 RepID=UPI0025508810|nr:hypothetical protein [Pedobacter sp. ELA7]
MNAFTEWWANYDTTAFFGDIVTGLVASLIFLFGLYLLKPGIRICDKIAFQYDSNAELEKRRHYSFKIVNRSLFFKVYDIQIRAWTSKVEPSINADDVSFKSIALVKDYQWVLYRMFIGHLFQDIRLGEKRLEKRTDYAAQFSTYDDLAKLIDAGHYVTVEVIAKHSLTGFTRVRAKRYKHKNDLTEGTFHSGNSCKIKV